MLKKKKKKTRNKSGSTVQTLIGIKTFTDYGLETNGGELLFFTVTPTNISVLSATSIETKIRQLMLVLSAFPDIEITCTDSTECFDANKSYLIKRAESEHNLKVKSLLKRDVEFLDEIQMELTTARQFLFTARCNGMSGQQVFAYSNNIEKIISEQGFEAHRMKKDEIKRLLAIYFDASLYGEQMPDIDGGQYFNAG